jgi:microcystin-dependent protein
MPLVNNATDQDLWGGELNNNMDIIDSTMHTIASLPAVPSGAIFWFGANTPPSGYLECNGALVSRTTYAALFAVVGTTFNAGDGSTTFGVPDLRGQFIRGWDDSAGIDPARVFGSTQADEFQTHAHSLTDPGHTHTTTASYASNIGGGSAASGSGSAFENTLSSVTTGITIGAPNSGNTGSETRPKNVALLPCIKT